jgi:DNA gyrase/topoisomerase IV subunit A
MIIRTGLDQIRSIGRNTQGVRLIKLKPGDKLVAAEKIIAEDANNGKDNSGNNKKPQAKSKAAPKPEAKNKSSKKRRKPG